MTPSLNDPQKPLTCATHRAFQTGYVLLVRRGVLICYSRLRRWRLRSKGPFCADTDDRLYKMQLAFNA